MKKPHLIIAWLLTCTLSWANVHSSHPEALESLDNASVFSIYQDGIGAIWLSTNYGLYRYNGNSLAYIYEELPQNALCGDRSDKSFFAVSRASFLRYDMQLGEMKEFDIKGIGNPAASVLCSCGCDSLLVGYDSNIWLYCNDKVDICYSVPGEKVSALCRMRDGRIAVGTEDGKIYSMTSGGNLKLKTALKKEKIHFLYEDTAGVMWVGTESDGVVSLDGSLSAVKSRYRAGRQARTICEDASGNLYIGCLDGLFIIDSRGIGHRDTNISPPGHAICSAFCDRDQNIWIGTYYSGLFLSEGKGYPFVKTALPSEEEIRLFNALIAGPDGSRYAFTDHYGIWKISQGDNWTMLPGTRERKFKTAVYDQARNCIWTGEHLGGLSRYDLGSHIWKSFRFENETVSSIFELKEKDGTLYIGTNAGVYIFDPSRETVVRRSINGVRTLIFSLDFDHDGSIWIGSRGLYRYMEGEGLSHVEELQGCRCCGIDASDDGNVYVATDGKGLCIVNDEGCRFIGSRNSGMNSDFTYLVKKLDRHVLVGSRIGISVIDPESGRCYNYRGSNGLGLTSTKEGGILTEEDGTVTICGTDGIVSMPGGRFEAPVRSADFIFDNIRINGKLWKDKAELPFLNSLELDHQSNNISIEVATFNFAGICSEQYRYRLRGFDDAWYDFSPEDKLAWNNLNPGSYILDVRLTGSEGGPMEKSLEFTIRPAWYSSTIAIIAYLLLFIALATWLLSTIWSRMLLSEKLKAKEKENNERMRFFVNISHELRTPLTLIVGQLELFFRSHKHSDPDIDKIESTYRNAQKMQQIVSDLLDFEKQEQGYTYIVVKETDLGRFIMEQRSSFSQYANFRNIDLQVAVPSHPINIHIDECQMQKVFSNLLINAFKFTPDGGTIKISLKTEKYGKGLASAVMKVSDSGCGISQNAIDMIFNPFFQDPESDISKRNQGSGIGLALCKGIIELHHGSISVGNRKNGGAEFTVRLPLGNSWMDGDEKVRMSELPEEHSFPHLIPELYEKHTHVTEKRYSMLIVEDDEDMREMISSIFSASYDVITASDGSEGFSLAKSRNPDIIISDVMMPVMNGLSLCTKLREEFETCHIPIILLTAHYSVRTSVNGMDAGADAYISKPFNIDLLDAKCRSLLENRELMRMKFCRSFTGIETIAKSDRDADLLSSVIQIIEDNIQESELSVSTLCRELNIGRTILAEKIKGITGMTPREFIESIKMKHAAQLLKGGNMRVSEIAYELGFNDPKYFTLRFRKQFGKSPSEYAKDNE